MLSRPPRWWFAIILGFLFFVSAVGAETEEFLALKLRAEKGDAEAQYNLGVMYKKGEEVTQDYAEAAKWFRKAFEAGNTKKSVTSLVDEWAALSTSSTGKSEKPSVSITTLNGVPKFNKSWIVPDLGLEMAWIEPGSFTMGSPASEKNRDDDERQHQVSLTKGFWLGKYEVTQGEWETLMGNNPSNFKNAGKRVPVETVSWEEAMAFCRKLTERERSAGRLPRGYEYSLPTEAQWEYACRAGTRSAFSYGNSLSSRQANFEGNYPYGGAGKGPYLEKTAPVGSYAPNERGLCDMHGNVWEWCYDWKGNYTMGTATDPAGPSSGSARVERGGSWNDYAGDCRSALRGFSTPGARSILLGFRLALRAVP